MTTTRLDWLRNGLFRSMQLRLTLGIIGAGVVPLLGFMLVFYYQTAQYAAGELRQLTERSHTYMIGQLEDELQSYRWRAAQLNDDAEIQRMLVTEAGRFSSDELELRMYIERLIASVKAEKPLVLELCFTFYTSNASVCGNMHVLELDKPLRSADDRYFETWRGPDGSEAALRYVAPLASKDSGLVRGHLAVLLSLEQRYAEYAHDVSLDRYAFIDAQGQAMFYSGAAADATEWVQRLGGGRSASYVEGGTVTSLHRLSAGSYDAISVVQAGDDQYTLLVRALMTATVICLLLLVLLSFAGTALFARYVSKPLQMLRTLMKRAERGDLKAYWTSRSLHDINELGESYNQMLNRLDDLIQQVKIEESLKKEKEMEALQYQLNPHFLYNTLNTIKWVAKIHKTPQISEAVSALVRLLQASLGKRGDFLTLREEMALIRDYMAIQAFRYGEEVELTEQIEAVAALCLVPKMILQPLVENALIHGLEQSDKPDKRIVVSAWLDRDLLFCQVEDNGRGMDEAQLAGIAERRGGVKEKLSGIGLAHIREKIKLYYGNDYKMHMYTKPNQGTTIRLSLPIHRSEE